MAWKHKGCGGEIIGAVTYLRTIDFKLRKDVKEPTLSKKIIAKTPEEAYGINYYCNSCKEWFEDQKVEEFAEWIKK